MGFVVVLACVLSIYSFVKVRGQEEELFRLRKEVKKLKDLVSNLNVTQTVVAVKEVDNAVSEETPDLTVKISLPSAEAIKPERSIEKKSSDLENWIGRNVLGIAAAILVFIGVVFFGVLTFQYMSDFGKMISMFGASGLLSGVAVLIDRKKTNILTQILMGTGFGCVFITILLSHVWLAIYQETTAFFLLLLWLMLTLWMSKEQDSLLLSILSHLGMAISVLMALALGMNPEQFLWVMIYQIASVIVLVGGTLLCYRKSYCISLFLSMVMMMISSVAMLDYVINTVGSFSGITILLFLIEFVGVSFLSLLIEQRINQIAARDTVALLQICNKIAWILSLFIMIFSMLNEQGTLNFHTICILSLCLVLIHGLITMIYSKKMLLQSVIEIITQIILSCSAIFILFMIYINHIADGKKGDLWPTMPLLFLLSGILFLGHHVTGKLIYKRLSVIVAVIDGAFMALVGYTVISLDHSALQSVLHMVLMLTILGLVIYHKRKEDPQADIEKPKALGYLFITVGLVSIIGSSELEYRWIIVAIILAILQFGLYYLRFDDTKKIKILMQAVEFILVSSGLLLIAQTTDSAKEMLLLWILTIAFIGLILIRILADTGENSTSFSQLWTGVRFTLLFLAIMEVRTSLLEYAYVISLVSMLSALLSIFIGIRRQAKILRLYGLSATLLCVLKMVTFDVNGLETMLRVAAFIAGGIICFFISALYSRLTRNDPK